MENLRGAAFMVLAMGFFAIEDALIKSVADDIPVGQIITVTCGGALILFLVWSVVRGIPLWNDGYLNRRVNLRSLSDVIGSCFFVTSLSLIPLTTASAVIQATPLVVALGAALFLGQTIGWRRWIAIIVGFIGVMIIIRPGTEGFDRYTLLAVGGMLGLAARDLLTRGLTVDLSGVQLATHTFALLCPVGVFLAYSQGQSFVMPNYEQSLILAATVVIGILAYLAIVAATRTGNAGIISSFRYSRMLFALIIGYAFFAERPDTATLIGAGIIIASGLFTLLREARLRKTSPSATGTL